MSAVSDSTTSWADPGPPSSSRGRGAPATRGGPPDDTTVFPNSFLVDYVRVYTTPPPVQGNSAG